MQVLKRKSMRAQLDVSKKGNSKTVLFYRCSDSDLWIGIGSDMIIFPASESV